MFGAFLIVAFFPLSIMFMLVVSMATKRKFTPSQNPVRFRALSSSDPTPSYIQFHDKDAERTSRRTFLDEVFIWNFADTDLPNFIHSRGWESLCDIPDTSPSVLIKEFYSNMHGFDYSVPLFHTCVRGLRIIVTP